MIISRSAQASSRYASESTGSAESSARSWRMGMPVCAYPRGGQCWNLLVQEHIDEPGKNGRSECRRSSTGWQPMPPYSARAANVPRPAPQEEIYLRDAAAFIVQTTRHDMEVRIILCQEDALSSACAGDAIT